MKTCLVCTAPLPGPAAPWGCQRRYCSVRCRRRREHQRRSWDRLQGWVRAAEMNAVFPGLTTEQRGAHRRRGEELRRAAGPRP